MWLGGHQDESRMRELAAGRPLAVDRVPVSAKPGWNPIPPGFVASWGRGIDLRVGGGQAGLSQTEPMTRGMGFGALASA